MYVQEKKKRAADKAESLLSDAAAAAAAELAATKKALKQEGAAEAAARSAALAAIDSEADAIHEGLRNELAAFKKALASRKAALAALRERAAAAAAELPGGAAEAAKKAAVAGLKSRLASIVDDVEEKVQVLFEDAQSMGDLKAVLSNVSKLAHHDCDVVLTRAFMSAPHSSGAAVGLSNSPSASTKTLSKFGWWRIVFVITLFSVAVFDPFIFSSAPSFVFISVAWTCPIMKRWTRRRHSRLPRRPLKPVLERTRPHPQSCASLKAGMRRAPGAAWRAARRLGLTGRPRLPPLHALARRRRSSAAPRRCGTSLASCWTARWRRGRASAVVG